MPLNTYVFHIPHLHIVPPSCWSCWVPGSFSVLYRLNLSSSTQPWRCLLHWGCQARPNIWSSCVLLGKYLAVEWKCSWVPKLLLACQSGWLWVMYVLNKFFLFPSCLNPFSLYHWLPILASFSGLACDLTAFQKIPQWKSCLSVFCLTWAFSPKHP